MMEKHDYIVHRANTPTSKQDTFEQVEQYIDAGYTKIEIDFYVTSPNEYKFCHPIGSEAVEQVLQLGDSTLKNFISKHQNVQWLIDPKCLDVPVTPTPLLLDIFAAFSPSQDIVTASQVEILEAAHAAGFQTCRYRQNDQQVSFEVEYYSMQDGEQSQLPKDKTFLYCPDLLIAQQKTGYAGVLVDGEYLD